MWADCGASFTTMSDLVGHVNLQHLRLPPVDSTPQPAQAQQNYAPSFSHGQQISDQNGNAPMDPSSLACLWADCRVYPTPASIPGPSIGDQTNNIIGILASHLMQDHLGLTASNPTSGRPPSPTSSSTTLSSAPSTTRTRTQGSRSPTSSQPQSKPRTRTPSPSLSLSLPQSLPTPSPPTPAPEHDCTSPSAHVCRWRGCGETFSSCDDLTAHITSAHVGGGKAHYECFWEGCKRNSEGTEDGEGVGLGGFSSKQKICRHLQVCGFS